MFVGEAFRLPAGEHSSPLRCVSFLFVGAICDRPLGSSIQHILNENAISGGGVVDEDVSNGADELAILDDGTAAHGCVKCRAKICIVFIIENRKLQITASVKQYI